MRQNPFKAIIFDCDGTLIDSEGSHFYAWQKVVLKREHFFSLEDFIHCMGNSNPAIAEKLAIKMNVPSKEELLSENRVYYEQFALKGQKPISHTVEFALKLAKERHTLGIKLAVASAAKKDEILHNLKLIGIEGIFDAIISGQDDLHDYSDPKGVNKPNPYIYWHTAKTLGVKPSECVVIEDSLPGLTAGLRAGCFTVAIPTNSTKIQDLSSAHLNLKSFENLSIEQFFHLVFEKSPQKASLHVPTVIFLNGTSSSGKTSLVQHLQERLDSPFIHIGIDHFLFMLPHRYRMYGVESHLGYRFIRNEDEEVPKISVTKGTYGNTMNRVMRNTINNLLAENFNLIIDEVLFSDDDFQEYLNLLKTYKVFFIAVKPPLVVAEQREKVRSERIIGLARGLYDKVYENKVFDLEIDTSCFKPEEAAQIIVQYIHNNPDPQAIKQNIFNR